MDAHGARVFFQAIQFIVGDQFGAALRHDRLRQQVGLHAGIQGLLYGGVIAASQWITAVILDVDRSAERARAASSSSFASSRVSASSREPLLSIGTSKALFDINSRQC